MHFLLILRWRDSESSVHVSLHICWNFRSFLYSLVGTKVQGSESSREWTFQGAKVPHLELLLPGANGLGSEKYIIWCPCGRKTYILNAIAHCAITIHNFDVVGISSFAYLRANTPCLLCKRIDFSHTGTPGSSLKTGPARLGHCHNYHCSRLWSIFSFQYWYISIL